MLEGKNTFRRYNYILHYYVPSKSQKKHEGSQIILYITLLFKHDHLLGTFIIFHIKENNTSNHIHNHCLLISRGDGYYFGL